MCHRITPLTLHEAEAAIEELHQTGRARVPARDAGSAPVPDAYPGTQVPLFVMDDAGALQAQMAAWGFDGPGRGARGGKKLVFNTRIETALEQLETGRGMWAGPIREGRCLVPVRGFFEWATRVQRGQQSEVRFTMPGRRVFLLAGVRDRARGCFSVVTTRPNASVSPVHSRMPLVLAPGESSRWLAGDLAALADRAHVSLVAE